MQHGHTDSEATQPHVLCPSDVLSCLDFITTLPPHSRSLTTSPLRSPKWAQQSATALHWLASIIYKHRQGERERKIISNCFPFFNRSCRAGKRSSRKWERRERVSGDPFPGNLGHGQFFFLGGGGGGRETAARYNQCEWRHDRYVSPAPQFCKDSLQLFKTSLSLPSLPDPRAPPVLPSLHSAPSQPLCKGNRSSHLPTGVPSQCAPIARALVESPVHAFSFILQDECSAVQGEGLPPDKQLMFWERERKGWESNTPQREWDSKRASKKETRTHKCWLCWLPDCRFSSIDPRGSGIARHVISATLCRCLYARHCPVSRLSAGSSSFCGLAVCKTRFPIHKHVFLQQPWSEVIW